MVRLWSEERVTFEGRFFRYRDASISPRPVQQPLPLWVGGSSEAAIRRTARVGTGWLAGLQTPEQVGRVIRAIKAAAAELGRTIDEDHYGAGFAYRFGRLDDPPVQRQIAALSRLPGIGDASRLVAVGDGDDDRLRRCEPEGEVAFVFFDEEGDHAFHGGDDPAVNDDGATAGAIFADVFEAELAGEVEVDLDGGEGFFFALGGGELDVDLGAVEGGFAFGGEVLEAEAVEDATEEGFAFFPHVGVVDVFFMVVGVAEGEAVAVVAEAEDAVGVFHELEDAFDFLLDHGWVGAEDVGVVEGHDADAAHAGDLSAFFPAMHVAEFGDADGEFAVGVELGGEDEDVGGAVHGAEDVFFAFALHDWVHGVVEVVPVA
ncbi:MAG: hypothetical protein C4320_05625 [Armatimonadota bacterium]